MSNWEVNGEIADFNKDGKVDAEDMSELLSKWGSYDLSSSAVHYTTTVTPIDPNNTKRI
jgi:hypothetical protein